ncbi:response regulator [Paenibacillus wenxiniae]|uniref:Response regulator n=1 Tax=Paenibacillus wenxiniae TaxID=1636843 RepID=A0ABW4RDA5_9BACL
MYTVIIVGDDDTIRNGLSQRINWEAYGFELLGTYQHGQQALQAMQTAMQTAVPNLILSDVSMPIMDGLELAEQVNQHRIPAKIILLTGFDEFHYARRAIKHQVHDFMMKPIMMPDVRSLLSRIRQEWDKQHFFAR